MLRTISITNYAIIDRLEVNFGDGLNIITGETGAGKSILVGALGLILGDRSDAGVLFNSERKCIVEGCFAVADNEPIRSFLVKNELDDSGELMIRREIAPGGKSRSFINDTPVTLSLLRQLSTQLADLHQQFDTLELGESRFQQEVLDAMAGNQALLAKYTGHYRKYILLHKECAALQQQQQEANRQRDYNQFMFDELQAAGLQENALESAGAEHKLLSHAEELKKELGAIRYALEESDSPLIPQLRQLGQRLQALKAFQPSLEEAAARLHAAQVELQDITDDLRRADDSVRHDPARIQALSELMAVGYRLLKKHGVQTTAELLAIRNRLEAELGQLQQLGGRISELESAARKEYDQCIELGRQLTAKRTTAGTRLTKEVNRLMGQVGMPGAALQVILQEQPPGETGCDTPELLFDANKTGRFEPLQKVASGGERSRLMLCIKSLVAAQLQMPTLIFDEIDTGISGEAARQVGFVLQQLAGNHQVITITHQPQIAARARNHFYVYKQEQQGRIATAVRLLSRDEQVEAIARMMGGEQPTSTTLQNAREMVEENK
jgi:DNA repair protein RecN (Recombination protein N)